jgi:hypothetical protein
MMTEKIYRLDRVYFECTYVQSAWWRQNHLKLLLHVVEHNRGDPQGSGNKTGRPQSVVSVLLL